MFLRFQKFLNLDFDGIEGFKKFIEFNKVHLRNFFEVDGNSYPISSP
jgi:hypothetical protein